MVYVLPNIQEFSMSACSICMRQKSRCTDGVQPKLVVVEAEYLSPDERTAFALLSSRVATALLPDPAQGELAAQCRTHGCTLVQTAVSAQLLAQSGCRNRNQPTRPVAPFGSRHRARPPRRRIRKRGRRRHGLSTTIERRPRSNHRICLQARCLKAQAKSPGQSPYR